MQEWTSAGLLLQRGGTGKAFSVLGPGLAIHSLPPLLCLAEVFCLQLKYSDVK